MQVKYISLSKNNFQTTHIKNSPKKFLGEFFFEKVYIFSEKKLIC